MPLALFNTITRKKCVFKPRRGKKVGLYTCGPTVYGPQHIGNYRTFIFEDILKRVLFLNGFSVKHVMNITDVGHLTSDADDGEDKIEKAARKTGSRAADIAREYEAKFKNGIKSLNIIFPDKFARATEHIKEQIKLVQKLEKMGLTYKTGDGVYFDTSKIKNYGKLRRGATAGIKGGARVALKNKKHETDFALWKFSPRAGPKRQMEWPSPWGVGFPGWHIECSAMSMKYLGSTLDIHTGGIDHIPVHHTNEIAQSEAATGKTFARFWMHGAFLAVKGGKMAKSSPEGALTLDAIAKKGYGPLDFRYLTLATHYRKTLNFSIGALNAAKISRVKLVRAYRGLPAISKKDARFKKAFIRAVNDDLNIPKALAELQTAVKSGISKKAVVWSDRVLGLNIKKEAEKTAKEKIPANISALAKKREMLRADKKWGEADTIRSKLEKLGFSVEDTANGPIIHRL